MLLSRATSSQCIQLSLVGKKHHISQSLQVDSYNQSVSQLINQSIHQSANQSIPPSPQVEATEVKLDDLDLSPEPLGVTVGVAGGVVSEDRGGALVQVDSLLDNVYCAAVEKLSSSAASGVMVPNATVGVAPDNHNTGPLITLADDDKDSLPSNSSFLFGQVSSSFFSSACVLLCAS